MSIRKHLCSAFVLFFALAALTFAAEAQTPTNVRGLSPAKGAFDLGIIFSADNILMDLDNYQTGLGVKMGKGSFHVRTLLDLLVNGSADAFSVNAGITAEYSLFPGPVSPYIGCDIQAGYMVQGTISSVFPFSFGVVVGAEVFVLDFLSVFAEYCLAADFTLVTDLQTQQTTFDYLIDTKMGNDAKLGIVLYLMRAVASKK